MKTKQVSESNHKKLSEICKIILSGTPKTSIPEYWNGDINWITPTDITKINKRYIYNTERKITKEGILNSSAKLLKKDTIVISARGTVGKLCIVPSEMSCNQSCYALESISELVRPLYLFYVLKNLKNVYSQIAHGTTFDTITMATFDEIKITLPSLDEQDKLIPKLDMLDSKIENLQKQNQILEQIIQSIFKSWFIDFEFLNEDGKSYKSFGGEIVYNEEYGKEIPKGWEVSNIDKEFNLVMGQSPPGKSYNQIGDGIAFFQGRTDFGHRFPSVRMFCSEPSRFAKKGDTLISVRAPVGDVNLALYDCCIGRGLSAIRHKSDSLSYTYYIMLNLKPIFDNFESEGTVFGSINKTSFEQIKILAPAKNIVSLFEKIVNPIDKKIEDNAQQIQTLSKIRDSLLPKLMSGEIQV